MRVLLALTASLGLALLPLPALADGGDAPAASGQQGIWSSPTLTGDWSGLRSWLADRGVTLGATETAEVLGNTSGGIKQGAVFEGRLEMDLGLDLEKLLGWQGATIHVSAYQDHGHGLSANNIGNLLTVSGIEAEPGTRLGDLYLEQRLPGGAWNIRVGQFAVDEEFLTSSVASVFINSTFGWPGINGIDLPGGGPAVPYATPGARVRYTATPDFSVQAAVFGGNPLANGGNSGGIRFPIDGAFAIVEADLSVKPGKDSWGLPATYKVGAWYNSLRFADLHIDNSGLSLANPLSTGIPLEHDGDFALYAAADLTLWHRRGSEDAGVAAFARVATAPQQDRNEIYAYADAGLTWKGALPGRDDDIAGIAFAWANTSHALRSLDHDATFYTGVEQPIRAAEMVLELTYQAAVTPWLTLQPDAQYVFHPGGNAPNPDMPTVALRNAAVFGLRSTITF